MAQEILLNLKQLTRTKANTSIKTNSFTLTNFLGVVVLVWAASAQAFPHRGADLSDALGDNTALGPQSTHWGREDFKSPKNGVFITARGSYSGPPRWYYKNVTDPATGNIGCEVSPASHCCCATPCTSTWSICPEPCGSETSSFAYERACSTPSNELPPERARYEINMTFAGNETFCRLSSAEWMAMEAPRTRGGSYDGLYGRCIMNEACPWAELRKVYSVEPHKDPASVFFIPNATANYVIVTQTSSAGLDSWSHACKILKLCPPAVLGWESLPVTTYTGSNPHQCMFSSLEAPTGILVTLNGRGQVACAVEKAGATSCLEIPRTCCKRLSGEYVPYVPLLSCDSIAGSEPDWCTRAATLVGKPAAQEGPLGPNCTWTVPPDPAVNTTGAGAWTPYSFFVVRRSGPDSFACLATNTGECWRPPDSVCAANAAKTAALNAPSKALVPLGYPPYPEMVGVFGQDSDIGEWQCVESYAGSGLFARGRKWGQMVAIEVTGGEVFTYRDAECLVPAVCNSGCGANATVCRNRDKDLAYANSDCQGMGLAHSIRPWCRRLFDVLVNKKTDGDRVEMPKPDSACVQSCENKGNFVSVNPSKTMEVPQCRGPDNSRCTWFSDHSCRLLAPGEPTPAYSGGVGYTCT